MNEQTHFWTRQRREGFGRGIKTLGQHAANEAGDFYLVF